jgi:cell division protein FtsW (lipid II flippase)
MSARWIFGTLALSLFLLVLVTFFVYALEYNRHFQRTTASGVYSQFESGAALVVSLGIGLLAVGILWLASAGLAPNHKQE